MCDHDKSCVGRQVRKEMRDEKGKSFLSLFLVIAVTVLFGVSCMYGVDLKGTGAAKNINLGLDLEGGVSITYQVKGDNPSQKDMDDTVYKLQKRVEQYSTEAQAYQVGDNRISIEIPGVNDANAILEELGQPGSLYLSSIRTVPVKRTIRLVLRVMC